MKNAIILAAATIFFIACNNEKKEEPKTESAKETTSSVQLPYTAGYSSQFNDKVSDQDLLTVLNSYKYWESGDMKGAASTLADSVYWVSWSGERYSGLKAGLVDRWGKFRDSLSSVQITMDGWTKDHSIDKNDDFILVWYKEIDTYKTGKVDSADYHDINQLKNGKIYWYSTYRQELKQK